LEQSHARLLAAIKYLSNDGKGCFKDWEDGRGRNIQERLERPIKLAEKLCASSGTANAQAHPSAPASVKEVSVVMGALLRKHGVIDAAAIDDPEGYDNYDTIGRLRRVAEDLYKWYSPNTQAQQQPPTSGTERKGES